MRRDARSGRAAEASGAARTGRARRAGHVESLYFNLIQSRRIVSRSVSRSDFSEVTLNFAILDFQIRNAEIRYTLRL